MSRRSYKVDTGRLPDGGVPVVSAVDRGRQGGDGSRCVRTLTQAVRAAEAAREDVRGHARVARDCEAGARAAAVRGVVWCAVLCAVQVVCLVVWFFWVSRV